MRRLLAILKRIASLALLVALAVIWRDLFPIFPSSSRFANWLMPDGEKWALADLAVNAVALFVAYLFIRRVLSRIKFRFIESRTRSDARAAVSAPIDRPIQSTEEDTLSRRPVVQGVIDLLGSASSDENTVVAIEGSWGSGKTSILRMVKAEIQKSSATDPLVIEFDPWPEDSKRGVVSRLLDVIAYTIGASRALNPASREEVERLFASLADNIATDYGEGHLQVFRRAIEWVDPLGTGSRMDSPSSLRANRQRISDAIASLGRRLVVVIDDLDRVDQDELVAILMAVNALSQLPRTNFLLAFDPEVVDSVLESKGFKARQQSFREKIVHVSVPLPPPSFVDLTKLFRTHLLAFLEARSLANDWEFWQERIRNEAITLCVRLSPTPRSLKRLANHSTMLLMRLRREVNAGDILLLELLRASFPAIWEFIRSVRNELDPRDTLTEGFVASDLHLISEKTSEEKGKAGKRRGNGLLERALEHVSESDRNRGKQVLIVLFPQLYSSSRARDDRDEAAQQSRVEIGSNLRKYFSLGVEGMQITDADVRTVIENPSFRDSILKQAQVGGFLDGMLSAVTSHIDPNARIPRSMELVTSILEYARSSWTARREDVTESAASLIEKVIRTEPAENRSVLLNEVVRSTLSISTTHNVILDLYEHAELWRNGTRVSRREGQVVFFESQLVQDEALFAAKEIWLKSAWSVGIAGLFETEPRPMRIIYRLAQLNGEKGNYDRVREELATYLIDDAHLVTFVSEYSPRITGKNYSVSGMEKLIRNWDAFLIRVKAMGEPSDAIEKFVEYEIENRPGAETRPA